MTDLEKRAEAFREKVEFYTQMQKHSEMLYSKDILAELEWAKKHPPDLMDLQEANPSAYGHSPYTFAWQSALDHVASLLGKEEGK